MSEESTLCDLPSVSVTRRSTTGWPIADAALHLRAHALLDADGMNWRGTEPPTTLSTNSKPAPSRQRLDLDVADGVLAVPAGLLDVPAEPLRRAGEGLPQRHHERHLVDVHAVPLGEPLEGDLGVRLAHASTAPAGGSRRCSRSAATGPRRRAGRAPATSLSSSALLRATIATGSSGSGIDHGRSTRGSSTRRACRRSRRGVSRPIAQMSPATTRSAGAWVRPNGCDSAPIRSSSSWSGWPASSPKNAVKWPETCTVWSGASVPEKTRTRLSRPTYGSLVVFTTSATSGPSGSQVIGAAASPEGVKTSGEGCSAGDGKPRTARSSSSAHPTPVSEHTGTTGWNVARATARSRSSTSTSSSISSPPT